MEAMTVNGKKYPLWGQFVGRKQEFIGGVLEDFGDKWDRTMYGCEGARTKITDVALIPNGKDSAFFSVAGEDFTCGFDVRSGGITDGAEGWLTFSGYGGHIWRIQEQEVKQ